jgi:hypothetical protein
VIREEDMVQKGALERRSAIRAKRVLSIQYRLKKSTSKNIDKNWYLSTTQDISATGLSFLTEKHFKKNDVLELHVVMSGILDIYKGLGRVVRVEKRTNGNYSFVAVEIGDIKIKRHKKSKVKKRF